MAFKMPGKPQNLGRAQRRACVDEKRRGPSEALLEDLRALAFMLEAAG
jgi:hypothetical protein